MTSAVTRMGPHLGVLAGLTLLGALAAGVPACAAGGPAPVGTLQVPPTPVAPFRRLTELKRLIELDNRNNPVASVALAEEGLALLKAGQETQVRIALLTGLVRDCTVLNAFPQAAAYLDQARALVAGTGEERAHFLLESQAASLLAARELPKEAKALLNALQPPLQVYLRRVPQDQAIGRALVQDCLTLGEVCRNLGAFSEAIAALQLGQKLCEELGDAQDHARILSQMGTLYSTLGRSDDAVASHKSAIAIAESLRDLDLQASLHFALSNTYGDRDDTEGQLAELTLASELAGRTRFASLQLTTAVNLADVYLGRKDYRSTLKFAEVALRMATAAHNARATAVSQVNRGVALNRLGGAAEGLRSIQEGLEHFKEAHAANDTCGVTGILAEEFAFAGDYRKAFEAEVLFKSLGDALKKSQDQKRIAEAGASFESDKKQLEINALQRDRRNQARLRLLWLALGTLGFAIAGVLVLSRKRLKSVNQVLAEMSLKDPLTSLANRRYLTTRIAEDLAQIVRMQRSGHSEQARTRFLANIDVVFLMIDIDHFKHVNDTYGHAAGDQVLKQFAFILSQTMRDSDTVVRWGGEEFFVVAKHTSREDSRLVAERIRARVEAFPFELGNGQVIHKTCSIGYSSFPFFRTDPSKVAWEKVAEVADQCLYTAKGMGRNTWVGVHEAGEGTEAYQEAIGAYPKVAELVANGILRAETRGDRAITWAG